MGGPAFFCFNRPHRRRPRPPAAGPAPHALAAQAHLRPEATADHVRVGGRCRAGSQRLCPRRASRDKADRASLGSEHRAAVRPPQHCQQPLLQQEFSRKTGERHKGNANYLQLPRRERPCSSCCAPVLIKSEGQVRAGSRLNDGLRRQRGLGGKRTKGGGRGRRGGN